MASKKIIDLTCLEEFLEKIKEWVEETFAPKTDIPSVFDGSNYGLVPEPSTSSAGGDYILASNGAWKPFAISTSDGTWNWGGSFGTTFNIRTSGLVNAQYDKGYLTINGSQDDKKADLNSPAFTGTPTAPTPEDYDNSTNVATTEFVYKSFRQEMDSLGLDNWQTETPIPLDNTTNGWNFEGFAYNVKEVHAFKHVTVVLIVSNLKTASYKEWNYVAVWDAGLFGGLKNLTPGTYDSGNPPKINAKGSLMSIDATPVPCEMDASLTLCGVTDLDGNVEYYWFLFVKGELSTALYPLGRQLIEFDFWVANPAQ